MFKNNNRPIKILHVLGTLSIGGEKIIIINLYRKIKDDEIQFDFQKVFGFNGRRELSI